VLPLRLSGCSRAATLAASIDTARFRDRVSSLAVQIVIDCRAWNSRIEEV
jgi:hypothetical protein